MIYFLPHDGSDELALPSRVIFNIA